MQYTPIRDFQLELEAAGTSRSIDGVPDMDDRRANAFRRIVVRLLDCEKSGFRLSVTAEPSWALRAWGGTGDNRAAPPR